MQQGSFVKKHLILTLIFAGLLLFILMPGNLERFLIYYPTSELEGDPSQIGLAFEDVFLDTSDGVRLHGWFIPRPGSDITIVFFHGNAGNISHRLPWLGLFGEMPAHILIIDYRGYGRSEGSPFERGLYRDADAAYSWWSRERPGQEKLVLLGESLGGAVAVDLASRVPVSGLILQSTFTSARDMAKTLLPLGLLQPIARVHFDSAGKIAKIRCPKLIIHGGIDSIVPFELGKKLYDLAPPPKEFYEVPRAGHNDLVWVAGPEYISRIGDFLGEISRQTGR